VRRALAELEITQTGAAAHADRVAVYAVAAAHELGISGDALSDLAIAAWLHDVEAVPQELAHVATVGGQQAAIIAAAEALDLLLHGVEGTQTLDRPEARSQFLGLAGGSHDRQIVEALLAIEPRIQPVGY